MSQNLSLSPIYTIYSLYGTETSSRDSAIDGKDSTCTKGLVSSSAARQLEKTGCTSDHTEPRTFTSESHDLCGRCAQLDLSALFQAESVRRPKRKALGNLSSAQTAQFYCQFCKFLVEACELAYPRETNDSFWNGSTRKVPLVLMNDLEGDAWHSVAGLETSSANAPYAWLCIGPERQHQVLRICISLEQPDLGTDSPPERKLLPRRRETLEAQNGQLDYRLIMTWLQLCNERHKDTCRRSTILERRFLDIYLIDVHTRSIRLAQSSARYVALSYVWGPIFRARYAGWSWTSASSEKVKGTVEIALPPKLPQTVEDAIEFTAKISERYLWVDVFCIDQHDPQHRQRQINNMDLIYQSAYLTVIALDGDHSDAGLSGISRPIRQMTQPTVKIAAGELIATHIPVTWTSLGSSSWDQRAWTMQEYVLSRRRVTLDHYQTIWTCEEESFHETMDVDMSSKRIPVVLGNEFFWDNCNSITLAGKQWLFAMYSNIVSIYSGRQLTLAADIIKACRGILNQFTRNTTMEFVHALPREDILKALLWKAHPQHCLRRRAGFPSWSWVGWIGRTEYTYWLHDLGTYSGNAPNGHRANSLGGKKRKRKAEPDVLEYLIPEPAEVLTNLSQEEALAILRIASAVAKFKVKLVRQHNATVKCLKSDSLQQRRAVGDQWTLIGSDGVATRDPTGEHHTFEITDHFFRVHPELSVTLSAVPGGEVELLLIKYLPYIRDSNDSNHWAKDMVSALVLVRNQDGTALRLASLVLGLSEWLAASPKSAVIEIR